MAMTLEELLYDLGEVHNVMPCMLQRVREAFEVKDAVQAKMLPILEPLAAIGRELRTQDNRITADPIFVVQQKRRTYGFDTQWGGDVVWIDQANDCIEADDEERARLEAHYDETGEEEDGWARTGYVDTWEAVQPFLAGKAADEYIAANRHNLKEPRTYVESAYRNREWKALRAACIAAAAALDGAKPAEDPNVALLRRCVPALKTCNGLASASGIGTAPGDKLLADVLAAIGGAP